MAELPLRIHSAGLAIERRGVRARIAAVVFAISFLATAVSFWILFSSYAPHGNTGLALCFAFPACLASACFLVHHRFQPPRSAASGARARGEILLGPEGLSTQIRRATRAYGRGDVVDGWIDEPGEVTSVVLRMRNGDVISIEVPTLVEARAVLLAASVSAEQQALKMRLANAMSQIPIGGCIATLGGLVLPLIGITAAFGVFASHAEAHARAISALVLAAVLLVFALLVRALVPARVVIGTDGIAVERMFGRTFIPYSQLTEVASRRGAVVLQLRGGSSLALPTGPRYAGSRTRADESPHTALLNRIEEARAAGRSRSIESACAADLDRAGRSLEAWRQHLRGLVVSESYRRASVGREEIAAVLEDASAPPQRRIAAALVLAHGDDAASKLRIADVVRTCADENLRAALEAAAEGELTEAEPSLLSREMREME